MTTGELAARLRENPFYVLELGVTASRAEVERQGQKLLGMLALDLREARTYPTPLGVEARTAERVRMALAELRDPSRRLVHELCAQLAPVAPAAEARAGGAKPWTEAFDALGFGGRV